MVWRVNPNIFHQMDTRCRSLLHFWCHWQPNDNICIYIYILFYPEPWPGHYHSRNGRKFSRQYLYTSHFREFSGRRIVSFSINYDVTRVSWMERDESEAGIICIFADTMSRKYKIYLSGQSPSLLCPQGTGDKVIISTEPGPGPGRPPSLCPQHQTRGNIQLKMRSKILTTKICMLTIIVSLLRLT